jgi:hypothetical protein
MTSEDDSIFGVRPEMLITIPDPEPLLESLFSKKEVGNALSINNFIAAI